MIAAPVIILGVGLLSLLAVSKKAQAKSADATVTTKTGKTREQKSVDYQPEVVKALQLLTVDGVTGEIVGTPTDEGIQYATGLVARLRADGFVGEANLIESFVKKAIAKKPAEKIVEVKGIPEAMQQEVNNVLKYSKDPKKVRAVADALEKLPNAKTDATVANTIEMLDSLADQLEAQAKAAAAVQAIDVVIQNPTAPVNISPTQVTSPASTMPAVTPIEQPKAKTAVEMAADAMVADIRRVQQTYGVKPAKGREDTAKVKRFQSLAGLTADGKAGPGTMLAAAKAGQHSLPKVVYWPTSATKTRVLQYRSDLNAVADSIAQSNPTGAEALRTSALAERGEAGIVGQMPA